MIRNVVFDLGNVLISFRPSEYLEKNNFPPDIRKIILSDIFNSPEWLALDNGNMTPGEAINSIAKKSSLTREEIALIFNKRTEIMFPLEDNIRLLPALLKKGFKLYYLSNFPLDIFDDVKKGYSFFKYFESGLISAEVNFSKPDPEIFRIFLKRYGLSASECFYIDDIEENIKVAGEIGMETLFTSGSTDFSDILSDRLNHK